MPSIPYLSEWLVLALADEPSAASERRIVVACHQQRNAASWDKTDVREAHREWQVQVQHLPFLTH